MFPQRLVAPGRATVRSRHEAIARPPPAGNRARRRQPQTLGQGGRRGSARLWPVKRLPPSRCPGCPPPIPWGLAPNGLTSRLVVGGEGPFLRASQPENHRYGEISLG